MALDAPADNSAPPQLRLPPARDRAFAGLVTLDADATDTAHGVIAVRETIPVQSRGDMLLLYPEWETASHAPTVPVASLSGLVIAVDGRRVAWRRDPADAHAFHVPIAAGARTVSIQLAYLVDRRAPRGAILSVPWQRLLLYPAGWSVAVIPVAASLRLPTGMTAFTALDRAGDGPDVQRYATTTLERLADAPVYAGRYVRRVDLAATGATPFRLDLLAQTPASLVADGRQTALLRDLVTQTGRVFGRSPYRHYDAIVALDDALGAGGIEHLEEGENLLPAGYFLDAAHQLDNRDLIAHELVHAWNGRFRQPADLATPSFNQPIGGSLLWVYEGQTEFWGRVLAARSGLRSVQETLDKLALDAAQVANRPGRAWKTLADSTNDAVYMAGRPVDWRDWQRREDYYAEGVLLWLDVEARLRQLSGGARGLDDFASRFFRVERPGGAVSTYTFADVCRALDAAAHDDWGSFLTRHLDTHEDADAMNGLARAGWRLVYTAEPSETFHQDEADNGPLNLTYAIGAMVEDDGRLASVAWNGPAFRAGLAPGMKIAAVGDAPYSRDALRVAVARTTRSPLRLTVGKGVSRHAVEIPYRGGLRYPRLQRIEGQPDRLTPLLAPRTG